MKNTANLINPAGAYTLSGVFTDGRYINKISMSVESAVRKVNTEKITFLKEKNGYWEDSRHCSNLILSILKGYPIGQFCMCHKNNNTYELFDGQARIMAIKDFIDNVYRMDSNAPSIPCIFKNDKGESFIEEYNISYKRFKDLPEALQDTILWYNLDIVQFHGYTNNEVSNIGG